MAWQWLKGTTWLFSTLTMPGCLGTWRHSSVPGRLTLVPSSMVTNWRGGPNCSGHFDSRVSQHKSIQHPHLKLCASAAIKSFYPVLLAQGVSWRLQALMQTIVGRILISGSGSATKARPSATVVIVEPCIAWQREADPRASLHAVKEQPGWPVIILQICLGGDGRGGFNAIIFLINLTFYAMFVRVKVQLSNSFSCC
jgi:hypothetical protein